MVNPQRFERVTCPVCDKKMQASFRECLAPCDLVPEPIYLCPFCNTDISQVATETVWAEGKTGDKK